MPSYDPIDEALNTTSSIEVSNTPEGGCVKRQDALKKVSDDVDQDYEYTRSNLYSLIEKGQESLNGIMELAGESASPRAYEVAGQIIKSVADTTDKLMELQKKVKEIDEDKGKPTQVTNNAVFVGSTSDLSKMLKDGLFEVIDLVKPDKLVPTFVKGAEYSDWRKELEESWSNVTTGNKVGQTFLHVPSGTTVSTGGAIGGVESIQSTINIAGEAVPAPDITSYTIQGYAVPFPGLIRKTKKEPVNTRLDASEKVAKKAKADVSMKARVDEKDPEDPIVRLNEWRKEVEKVGEYNDKIREANRAKAAAYVSSKGFSWNKLEKEGALVDDKGYGIMITNGTPGGKIMTGKIKIGYGRPYTRKDTTQDGEFLGRKNSKGSQYTRNGSTRWTII